MEESKTALTGGHLCLFHAVVKTQINEQSWWVFFFLCEIWGFVRVEASAIGLYIYFVGFCWLGFVFPVSGV